MRELKFRGMDANGVMRYGRLVQDKPNETVYYKDYSQRICWDYSNIPVSNESLGESIGLKDRNDKEIYEGDIIKAKHGFVKYIGNVVLDKGSFSIKITKSSEGYNNGYPPDFDIGSTPPIYEFLVKHGDSVEVIGNIYEHPHLLLYQS